MQREYVKWFSPSLGRDMEMLVFGHSGTPILAFPSSLGRFYEWEDFGMVEALGHQLGSGFNRLYCVDSVDAESLYNRNVDPYVRIKRHQHHIHWNAPRDSIKAVHIGVAFENGEHG